MDPGTDRQVAESAEVAWHRQSVWSQAANHLKGDLTRWRAIALGLTIAGAVLATLAVQVAELSSPIGKGLAWAGGGRRRVGPGAVRKVRVGGGAGLDSGPVDLGGAEVRGIHVLGRHWPLPGC